MANVVYKIDSKSDSSKLDTQIMTVCDVLNGEVISLFTNNEVELSDNFVHASTVPFISVGDQVIVQKISGNFIIIDKLRNIGEKPTIGFTINDDGSLDLFSDVKIELKTINAKIDISASGKILVDGNEIYSRSNGVNKIQGANIELN